MSVASGLIRNPHTHTRGLLMIHNLQVVLKLPQAFKKKPFCIIKTTPDSLVNYALLAKMSFTAMEYGNERTCGSVLNHLFHGKYSRNCGEKVFCQRFPTSPLSMRALLSLLINYEYLISKKLFINEE